MPSLELQLLKDSEGAASVRDVLPSEIQAGPSGTVARTQAHVVCANSLMTTLQRMKCGIACLLLATSARAQTALRPFADADAVRLNAPRSASLLRDLDSSLEQVVAKVSPAVVQIVDAKLLGTHKQSDLALLKVEETHLPTVPLRDDARVRQGELVFAIGSPEGLRNSVTMGVVSSVARQPDPDDPRVYIQTDAA